MIIAKKSKERIITLMNIVALLELLVNELFEAEESFLQNVKDLYSFENAVRSSTDHFAAGFIGTILSSINKHIYDSSWRKGKYTVQRTDTRTLISSVGDITFDCTYYKSQKDGSYSYLIEKLIGIDKDERFTEAAEVAILTEAAKTSYAEAAKVLPSKQKITKSTVMNKVHHIAEQMPEKAAERKKKCTYLYIEADEDHVSEQHGRWGNKADNKGFISRLAYIYEYKRPSPECEKRKELVNTFYFSGLYSGSDGVEAFWNNIGRYIENHYDTDYLKRIFVLGDGAGWIKSGAKYLDKAMFCADKYHLMQYIGSAANQMLDESAEVKGELYRLLYKKDRKGFIEYTQEMMASAEKTKAIEELQTFVNGNWAAIMRTLHNKKVEGCSAEGHVSHVLSARLSSRPKGWSQRGADRMSKLRCYEKNYGREKIIELVRYSREQERLKATGTEEVMPKRITMRDIMTDHRDQTRIYMEKLQARIPGITVRKVIRIREQLGNI